MIQTSLQTQRNISQPSQNVWKQAQGRVSSENMAEPNGVHIFDNVVAEGMRNINQPCDKVIASPSLVLSEKTLM